MPTLSSFGRAFFAASLIISAAAPLATHAAVPSGSLIKGTSSSSVYYVEAGKRYSFPNEKVFNSWYADFSSVVTVPDTELANYILSANVTYRPGSVLVKITTDPKVYAVSRYGVLRWITSESMAVTLYGANWNTKVHDIPDTFFTNYLVGSDIQTATDYSVSEEIAVTMIGDNIRPANFAPPVVQTPPPPPPPTPSPTTPTVAVSVSASQATLNQMVLVFATVSDSSRPITKIEMYSNQQTSPHATCTGSTTCSFTYTVTQAPLSAHFWAAATNDQGVRIESPFELQATLNVANVSTDITMSASPFDITAGARVNYSSDASKFQSITSHKVYIIIPGEPNPYLWKDCGISTLCASSSPIYRTTQFFSKVTTGGQTYQSASVTVKVTSGTAPKPVLTLLSKPAPNQAEIRLDAPSGETIGWSSIVEGTSPDDYAIALCEFSTCEITVEFSTPVTYTAFTDVGGKLEASNSLSFSP